MNTATRLSLIKERIDSSLKSYLSLSCKGSPGVLSRAIEYCVNSCGKRIRPILTIESCIACGGKPGDAMPAACAIELAHTYSLIHDDLPAMDDDDYRRGKPTCHKVFGEANAILAGDGLLALAFNILSKESDPKAGIETIRELSDAIGPAGMVAGQVIDLKAKGKRKKAKEVYKINLLKTARLFEASAKIGGIAAGAGRRKIEALGGFGLYMGVAFQAIDDMLDDVGVRAVIARTERFSECAEMTKKAKRYLRIFGRKARRLEEIADHALNRTN